MPKFVLSPKQVLDQVSSHFSLSDNAIAHLNDVLCKQVSKLSQSMGRGEFILSSSDLKTSNLPLYERYLRDAGWDAEYKSTQHDGDWIRVVVK